MNTLPRHIYSPCVGICRLGEIDRVCVGCGRTVEEISGWMGYTVKEKRAILDRIEAQSPPGGRGTAIDS